MRRRTGYLIYIAVLLVFMFASQTLFLNAQEDDLPEWTFMVYIAADNNLEPFAMRDIAEMEINGSTDDVNIVVQMDRARGYSRDDGDWTGARRYYITENTGLGIGSEVLEDMGDINMADPQTLADFGVWAMETYPAKKYALVLWDHGGSWVGFAHDESAGDDIMTMEGLDEALSEITTTTGIDKLDIIGFDACLMGGYEVYSTIAPYANYSVASSALIPGFGWDYDFALFDLIDNPEMDAIDFGKSIIDNFISFYDNEPIYSTYSLSLVDLNAMSELEGMLVPFTNIMKATTTPVYQITLARNATIRFGSLSGDFTRDAAGSLGIIDMFQFADNIGDYVSENNLLVTAEELLAIQDTVVLYHQTSESLASTRGLSVYFPTNQIRPQPDDNTIRYGINSDDPWAQSILEFYNNIALGYSDASPFADFGSAEAGEDGVEIPVDGTDFDVVQTELFTTDAEGNLVGYEVVDPTEYITWEPTVTEFSLGDTTETVVTFSDPTDSSTYSVLGSVTNEDGRTSDVEWIFDAETGKPQVMWIWLEDPFGTVSIGEYRPDEGDTFQLYTFELDENNEVVSTLSDIEYDLGSAETEEFSVTQTENVDGEYEVVVALSDAGGNSAEVELTVDVQDGNSEVTSQQTVNNQPEVIPTVEPVVTEEPLVSTASTGTCNPDTANLCLAGNEWGDGRCVVEGNPEVTAYNFELGWYRAAYECGAIDSYPDRFTPPESDECPIVSPSSLSLSYGSPVTCP